MTSEHIEDRIKSFARVKAADLIPNPKNWRTHPKDQRDTLTSVLRRVGYADAVIARETDDGLMLIDGHLRTDTADPNAMIPTLIVDLNEEEADILLATLDPLAAMAGHDDESLSSLLESVSTDDETLSALLRTLEGGYDSLTLGDYSEGGSFDQSGLLTETKFEIVISCDDEQQQYELLNRLTDEGLLCRSLIS
jgi:hypothetical protein